MKKLLFIAIVLFSLFSCNKKIMQNDKLLINQKEFQFLVNNFKYTYFTKCLRYGLNDSKAVNEILKQETSITDFELGLLNYKSLIVWH